MVNWGVLGVGTLMDGVAEELIGGEDIGRGKMLVAGWSLGFEPDINERRIELSGDFGELSL